MALGVLVGCAPTVAETPAQADHNLNIMLEAAPEGKDGDYLTVILRDAAGAPITDATVTLEGNMNHAGMVPLLTDGVQDATDGAADGRYQMPLAFSMLGDWIMTVQVTRADGSVVSEDLAVQVSEAGVTGAKVVESAEMDGDLAHDRGVQVRDPKARPSPLAGGNGAVYFLLHNGTDAPIRFSGAETPAADAVEIHETVDDNGTMRMRQLVDGIALAPDESATLAPGGLHMMLIGLAAPLVEGATISVTLHFDGADDLTVEVPVVSMDALSGEGSMMNHNH
jgi:copper(I)-binding protein